MCIKKEFKYEFKQEFEQNNRIYAIYAIYLNSNGYSDAHVCYTEDKSDAKDIVEKYNKLLKQYKNKYLKDIDNEDVNIEFCKENKLSFIAFSIKDLKTYL